MISRDNRFEGFCTDKPINTAKLVEFLDSFSSGLKKKTFIVLDTTIHRSTKMRKMRSIWEKRGLFIFYLPPCSPHLNIAETLWRVMKGKWIRPQDYLCADTLFYVTNRALAAIGKSLRTNYNHNTA